MTEAAENPFAQWIRLEQPRLGSRVVCASDDFFAPKERLIERADPVFLPSLQRLAIAVGGNEQAAIQAISYRAGVVDVRLTAPDVATLDRIRQSVSESARFSASIQSTDRVGNRVNSRIQIREAGS